MPSLFASVSYATRVNGWEPAGLDLVQFTQDNPLLDAHRKLLAAEFPRRKFETELEITVGGLRADKGTYYRWRERPDGLARLAALQDAHKLGVVNGCHLISHTHDPDDLTRRESTFVSVGARFPGSSATASLQTHGPFGDRHLQALVPALWNTFQRLVAVAPVARADAHWDDQWQEYLRPAAGDPPVAAFMFLDGPTVAALGGKDACAERLEALSCKAVRRNARNGVVVQLGRRPEDTTGERLARIRSQLRTVI